MQERRSVSRYKASLRSLLKSSNGKEEKENFCQCQDISIKGARLILSESLIGHKEIELKINLPRYLAPIPVKAQIVWESRISNSNNDGSFEIGLFFTKIKERDKTELMDFLKEVFPEEILTQWWNGV